MGGSRHKFATYVRSWCSRVGDDIDANRETLEVSQTLDRSRKRTHTNVGLTLLTSLASEFGQAVKGVAVSVPNVRIRMTTERRYVSER